MNINYELKCDLLSRGFEAKGENDLIMEYASGSISNYKKCKIYLNLPCYGDIAQEVFYPVRLECFSESGQPEFDYHDIINRYIAESNISAYLKKHGILSKEERDIERAKFRKRIEEVKRKRAE